MDPVDGAIRARQRARSLRVVVVGLTLSMIPLSLSAILLFGLGSEKYVPDLSMVSIGINLMTFLIVLYLKINQ